MMRAGAASSAPSVGLQPLHQRLHAVERAFGQPPDNPYAVGGDL
jgi:hypothetical protein